MRNPGQSSFNELSKVYVLSLEYGWMISEKEKEGRRRKRVEDCDFFFNFSLPLSKKALVMYVGSSSVGSTVEETSARSFHILHSESIPSSQHL